jgi:hypothetical protein
MTKTNLILLVLTCIVELFCIAVLIWPARASESCNCKCGVCVNEHSLSGDR